jgi:hypothetical protein
LSSDVTGALVGGTPFGLTLSRAGRNGRLTFNGNSGEVTSVAVAPFTTVPAGQSVVVRIYKPDATQLMTQTITGAGGTLNAGALPATGTYTVTFDPAYGATVSTSVTKTP